MELKDVILSTLAEMDAAIVKNQNLSDHVKQPSAPQVPTEPYVSEHESVHGDESRFLENLRERLLVLFEGFQSPNNKNIEAKVDLTLNFLEYLLSTIDTRIEKIKT
ncbi:MAG: hypothetical protein JXK05_10815 [Campylobacterales bacterium]|nr:hypothetical protein [Campylobacterales bacterium]